MEVTFNIMMVNGLYINEEFGDGPYYFLRELTPENISKHPPKLLNDDGINEWIEYTDCVFVDQNTGYEFTNSDILFSEIKMTI